MKEIELSNKEIELIISVLDFKISSNLDKVFGDVQYSPTCKHKLRKENYIIENLIDKLIDRLNGIEIEGNENVLKIDWNMEEFEGKLKEIIEEYLCNG
ncbi:hypothetical protein REK96_006315 [Clostridioides difficile]|nr:hypothetical protein [Clostridioides difficile]EGT4836516.1 hypothetical protein [Clostridioides difficile]EGT4910227.1 hypothetical protein [Clostridioides difficile]EKS6824010.1 hypothetical protein [Clostridioides difficile]MBF9826594.1 hypothetical protein [Clostridioides difficile]